MKTFDCSISSPANPIGFDVEVLFMQKQLAKIGWLQSCFGQSHLQKRSKSEGEATTMQSQGYRGSTKYEAFYPQGLQFNADGVLIGDIDLSFDDTYASRLFFYVSDNTLTNIKVDNWDWTENNVAIGQKFSIFCHVNLNSLEITSADQIKLDILYYLNLCPKIVISDIFENMDNIYKEFTITPEINGISRYPNYCIRIDGICTYLAYPYNKAPGYTPNY